MSNEQADEQKNETPSWLKKLQEGSWEAELLISGGAIFSLIQLLNSLTEAIEKSFEAGVLGFQLLGAAMFVIMAITGGFIIHLILRGFWLSLIMLQKIYPSGINYEKIKLSEPFLTKNKQFNLLERISGLDKTCSLIFVWSFTVALVIIGFFLTGILFLIPSQIGIHNPEIFNSPIYLLIHIPVIILMIGWYLFLLSGTYFRRGKIIPKLWYPIYQFYNTISLGFVWRPITQTIFSNTKNKISWFFVSIVILFLIISFIDIFSDNSDILKILDLRRHSTAEITTSEDLYQDKVPSEKWTQSMIQSDVITENYIRLFVPYSSVSDGKIDSIKSKQKYFENVVLVSLNDSICHSIEWTGLKRRNDQQGIMTILDITKLQKKRHILTIISPTDNKPDTVKIPFWKQ